MKRRKFLAKTSLLSAGIALPEVVSAGTKVNEERSFLTVAHITDVHIRPEDNIPNRALDWLNLVKKHQPDFYLNGGDSIHDASYKDVSKERVLEQWKVWDLFRAGISEDEVYSCIGNHDPWWDVPNKEEEPMYGKPYVVKRLGMPAEYYSFDKGNWHFIILDGNYEGISLGEEQMKWLEKDLEKLPANTPTLVMSHFPITSITNALVGGQHKDHKELKSLFYKHKDKVRVCLSGHQHLLDRTWYNDVHYFCNGSLSGFWWGEGDEESAGKQYYLETPPGYAILKLHDDGRVENEYFPLI
ncbi:metallophosphoesterase family protein [Algoriphagus machipongonensis]|uniref:Metallophosphoesterase n=1 Tax=Algoriphagus machipongonensis TaxID=388413 RepID=A3HUN2_9BACT|nr:metallophosphoesterase [Algoriphagus machipongonensis]EAZ81854.1 putative metallophosphoesterase [Algoriphagus machipongonensis]